MKGKININTLKNFSKGKYSYNTYLKVKERFCGLKEDKELEALLLNQWHELTNQTQNESDSLEHLFEKIQYDIWRGEKRKTKKISLWNYYRQVAAILLIPVLAFSIWYYYSLPSGKTVTLAQQIPQSWVEINAPDGARVEFFLPDSTRGWLNSGSTLKYPGIFGQKREVELTGEAWFDVKHRGDASEFVVNVPQMEIKVLGTQFNVSAYPDDAFADVTLEKGKVEVSGKSVVFKQTLAPNERIVVNYNTKTATLVQVDANRFSAWKNGYLIIDDEPLGQVVNRLERWYNVEIEILDDILKQQHFKATFKDEPLEEVLKLISKSTPIQYSIEKRSTGRDGVFKQKKITMRLKK